MQARPTGDEIYRRAIARSFELVREEKHESD
jgi:hypothetical protein